MIYIKTFFLKIFGWKATIMSGDPSTLDRWKWIRRHLQKGSLRTLDAGCGSGSFTMYAAKIGNIAIGISHDVKNNTKARNRAKMFGITNIQFLLIDLRDLHLSTEQLGKFDQIICMEVAEHIINDKKLIHDLSFLLKPGGQLLLTVPNLNNKHIKNGELSKTEDGGHVRWGYTFEEIQNILNSYALDIITEEHLSGFITQKLIRLLELLGGIESIKARFLVLPFRVFQIFDFPITKLLKYPSLSLGIIAIKRSVNFYEN